MKSYPRILADSVALTVKALAHVAGAEPTVEHPNFTGDLKNTILNSPRARTFCRIANNSSDKAVTLTIAPTVTVAEGSEQLTTEALEYTIAFGDVLVVGPWSNNFENGSSLITLLWDNSSGVISGDVDLETFKLV